MGIRLLRFVILIGFLGACSGSDTVLTELKIGEHSLQVEIADTEEERSQGLMYRTKLGAERGMLFVFEYDRKPAFWMKNTRIPLSLAYIDRNGRIRSIHALVPFDEVPVYSEHYVRYALEVNRGYFAEHNIQTGDLVEIPDF